MFSKPLIYASKQKTTVLRDVHNKVHPIFLPDFSEKGESDEVEDILFMIGTSGSMSDEMITAAYSEVKGAIDQFGGKLRGWLGF